MSKAKNTSATLPRPLPATGSVPFAGKVFYGAGREKSYRLAKAGAIITLDIGKRSKVRCYMRPQESSASTRLPRQ